MSTALAGVIHHYGYLAVLIVILLEDFGVPAPGETVLIAAAVAAASGELNIWGVVAAGIAGAIIGDNIGYAIGHFGGRRLVHRLGSRVGLGPDKFEHAEGFFKRFGDAVVVGARFVEVLRQLNGIIAGTMGMHWKTFLAYNALGAVLWVGVWSAVGYLAGHNLAAIEGWFLRFSWVALIVIVLGGVAYAIVLRRRAVASKPPKAAE
jgi:membrane protein DedA with SNARE-associated domain